MAHAGTQPDAQTGLIKSLGAKDGQVIRQLAAYTHAMQKVTSSPRWMKTGRKLELHLRAPSRDPPHRPHRPEA